MQETKSIHPFEKEVLVNLLNEIIACADHEIAGIYAGKQSHWCVEWLKNIVLPEMTELLTYAENQKVFFKWGADQRMLESAYLLTDSLGILNSTELGQKVSKLQEIYRAI